MQPLTIEIDTGDEVLILPAKYEICSQCDGHGTDRGRSVECDGGGFTASEWAEQDDEFKHDYINGFYDQPCEGCKGHVGRMLVLDRDRCKPEVIAKYDAYIEEEEAYQSMVRAERRMGC